MAPVRKRFVAGDNRRALFVALADKLEEPGCRGLIELDVSELVDDEQRNIDEMTLFVPGNAVELCDAYLIEEVLRAHEVDAMTVLQGVHSKSDRQVRLADAGRSEEHDILCSFDEGERLQLVDRPSIERVLCLEVKGVQLLYFREMSELRAYGDADFLACCAFVGKQRVEKLQV